MSIAFKGVHFPKFAVLFAAFFYVRYPVSYRDLEEIMAERGVEIDHATLNRWVVRFSPRIAELAQHHKRATAKSWRMDETYIKVRGKWTYFYRAVYRDGQTLDFMLSERRNLPAARRFFRKVIASNGVPEQVVIDKSGTNLAGLQAANVILKGFVAKFPLRHCPIDGLCQTLRCRLFLGAYVPNFIKIQKPLARIHLCRQ